MAMLTQIKHLKNLILKAKNILGGDGIAYFENKENRCEVDVEYYRLHNDG